MMNLLTAQKSAFFILLFLTLALPATAQEEKNPANTSSVTADESFTLNITESRISETVYERSTDVRLDANGESSVRLQIGATVRAQSITINLRGITGNVRFRASLEKIRRLIQ